LGLLRRRRDRHDGRAERTPLTPEVLRKVRSLGVRTRGLVDSLFMGEYAAVFSGRGLEFSSVRDYQPGDDVRAIDWKVTARRQSPFVRQFVEERNLLGVLMVDISASGQYGPGERSAGEVAEEVAAALAFAASRQSDRVGLLLVSDRVEFVLRPASGPRHLVRLVATLLSHRPQRTGTDLTPGLEWINASINHRATVFMISDFIQSPGGSAFRQALTRVASTHDLIAVRLASRAADELPDVGWVEMTDPESGRRVVMNTGSRRIRERYKHSVLQARADMALLLTQVGADLVDVNTATDHLMVLADFFRRRQRANQ
jgi:uncharacterized protein (DUF58 family)